MKICVIGGGNIGALMAAEISRHPRCSVSLLTSRPEKWNETIEVIDTQNGNNFYGHIDMATNDLATALKGAGVIFITVPASLFGKTATRIAPYVENGTFIGAIPGTGGAEFHFSRLIKNGCTLFGLQRVHSIARLKE